MAWRDDAARSAGVEKYKILSYNAIDQIAEHKPQETEELGRIKGIGPVKLRQYGETILSIVNEEKQGEPQAASGQEGILTVSEFLDRTNSLLSRSLPDAVVRGEVSSFSEHRTGLYFTLTDEEDESVLHCYMPPGAARETGAILEEGMQVKVAGDPNIYKPRGKFTLVAAWVEPVGEGSLRKAYELLKKKLESEGLFERKRELPEFIRKVGLITSRSGAAIDDFCRNLRPLGIKVEFFHTSVEGARAVSGITRAINYLGRAGTDLEALVIVRGGGGLEDLQPFNNEQVARAVFASRIPTISGIGHERDVPIASLVADAAVSTPTAAAVRLNSTWDRAFEELPAREQALLNTFSGLLKGKKARIAASAGKLSQYVEYIVSTPGRAARELERSLARLKNDVANQKVRINELSGYLARQMEKAIKQARNNAEARETYLKSADPERNLKLGYTITTDKQGKVLKSAKQAKEKKEMVTRFTDGEVESATRNL